MKYIFIDIDGTLYSTKINGIPESAKKAIKLAKDKGNKVFLCTGRSLAESKLFLNLDIDGFVFCAGTLIYVEGKRIYEKSFDIETVQFLIKTAQENNLGICLEGYAGAYYDEKGYESLIRYFAAGRSRKVTEKIMLDNCFYGMDNYHLKDPISKVNVYGETVDQVNKLKEILPHNFKGTIALADEEQFNFGLEVTDKDINKATGIQHVLDQYAGATFKDVVAIGDSANDIDMVEAARIGIAMGNAALSLKNCADYISSDILDDGLYKALEHYKLI